MPQVEPWEARSRVKLAAGVNVVLGLAVMLIPFFTGETRATFLNDVIVGLLVVIFAGYDVFITAQAHTEEAIVPATLNVLLGLWLVVFVLFQIVTPAYFWANIVLGLLIAAVAAYNAHLSNERRQQINERHEQAA